MSAPAAPPGRPWWWLIGLLVVSAGLRLAMVHQGGQFFFGDEGRHERGVALYQAIRAGDGPTIRTALARPEHIGFTVLGAGITALQHLTAQFTTWGDWRRPENVLFTYGLGASWLALFSVANIALVYALARRSGATTDEADWAALLMACSNTGFYYARHFLPYDAALTFALGAILAGLDQRRALWCGLLAGATYHVYNGYWYLVPVAAFVCLRGPDPAAGGAGRRLVWFGVGAGAALALPVLVGVALAGRNYWQTMVAFSDTVNQGLYREGWSLPWEYFWYSEGLSGVAVLAAIAAAAWRTRRDPAAANRPARLWLGALAFSYGWLVLFSVGLEKFVVYARTVKPFVPLFCLAGGWAAARLLAGQGRTSRVVALGCGLMAAVNFLPHFGRTFPAEVENNVLRELGNPKHTLAVSGSIYVPLALPVQRPDLVLVNAQLLYPIRDYLGFPAGTTLVRLEHPLTYRPFQYESHNPRERDVLRTRDISIRLIRLAQPAELPDDLPVSLRFTAGDRPDGRSR
jgi:hypothetical protein